MKNIIIILVFSCSLYACGGGNPEVSQFVEQNDGFDDVRAAATTKLSSSVAPAVSIAIYKDGEVVFAEAFGEKILGENEVVNKDTLFQMGSTTKMFTVLASLRLVGAGVFSVDDTLIDVFPGVQIEEEDFAGWQEINVHHLMSHLSGLSEVIDFDQSVDNLQDFSRESFPALYGQINPAGRFWNYSNTNWSYLGSMLEYQLNDTFSNVIEAQAFSPLEMSRTTVRKEDVLIDGNYALGAGFIWDGLGLVEGSANNINEIYKNTFSVPAGSYTWSTPTEMLKMAEFLLEGNADVLDDDLREKMVFPHADLQVGIPLNYGYGLFVAEGFNVGENWYPMKRWDHGGNTTTYTSMFWMLPEENIAVVILSSGRVTDFSETMKAALSSVMTLPAPQQVPVEPVAIELFKNHVGRYISNFGVLDANQSLIVNVSLLDGEIMIDIPVYNEDGTNYDRTLEPLTASVFRAKIDEGSYNLTFLPEVEGGESVYIRHRNFVAIRDDTSVE